MVSLRRQLTRSPFRLRPLARLLFGIEFGPLGPDDHYFDLVTPALLAEARRTIPRGAAVLDLGTGAHAVIGLSLRQIIDARVIAVDIDPVLADLARTAARLNGADMRVLVSRFFDAVADERFDYVVFNPPYMPTATAAALDLPDTRRSQWDGGASGLEVIRGALAALANLRRPVTLLMGVNRWFVPASTVASEIAAIEGVDCQCVRCSRVLPVDVHLVTTTKCIIR
jgi:methylase of polypeptide subunit release factors